MHDTFKLRNGDKVRLLGVNTPEHPRCGATASAKLLKTLVLNKPVRMSEDKRDAYNRRMGLVYIGSELVYAAMLEAGLARPDIPPIPKTSASSRRTAGLTKRNAASTQKCVKRLRRLLHLPIARSREISIKEHGIICTICPHAYTIIK